MLKLDEANALDKIKPRAICYPQHMIVLAAANPGVRALKKTLTSFPLNTTSFQGLCFGKSPQALAAYLEKSMHGLKAPKALFYDFSQFDSSIHEAMFKLFYDEMFGPLILASINRNEINSSLEEPIISLSRNKRLMKCVQFFGGKKRNLLKAKFEATVFSGNPFTSLINSCISLAVARFCCHQAGIPERSYKPVVQGDDSLILVEGQYIEALQDAIANYIGVEKVGVKGVGMVIDLPEVSDQGCNFLSRDIRFFQGPRIVTVARDSKRFLRQGAVCNSRVLKALGLNNLLEGMIKQIEAEYQPHDVVAKHVKTKLRGQQTTVGKVTTEVRNYLENRYCDKEDIKFDCYNFLLLPPAIQILLTTSLDVE